MQSSTHKVKIAMLKKFGRSPIVLTCVGNLLASYLLLVRKTSSMRSDPPNYIEKLSAIDPFIVAMWHGQTYMMPFSRPADWDVRAIVSKSPDGEMKAIALSRLGLGIIRASGAQKKEQVQKRGGMRGFKESLRVLKAGGSIALTADVPKGPARQSGLGIIQLARLSNRPIVPFAATTNRYLKFNTWDELTVNLPFSRIGLSIGEPIWVPRDSEESQVKQYSLDLTDSLNQVSQQAYKIAKSKV